MGLYVHHLARTFFQASVDHILRARWVPSNPTWPKNLVVLRLQEYQLFVYLHRHISNCMKLSKDQVRIIKSETLYACTVIVFYPLAMLALGKAMS